MSRKAEFRVVPAARRANLVERPRRSQTPKITIHHISLGEGTVTGLRLGDSGVWLVTIRFGNQWKTLRLEQAFFTENVNDIVAMASQFPQSKPPVEKESKKSAVEDEEPETEELDAERAFLGDDTEAEDEGEESGDGMELEETA